MFCGTPGRPVLNVSAQAALRLAKPSAGRSSPIVVCTEPERRVDADTERAGLERGDLGELIDPGLGGRVVGVPGGRGEAFDRADVDEIAALAVGLHGVDGKRSAFQNYTSTTYDTPGTRWRKGAELNLVQHSVICVRTAP
jgi:hypothetical protein